ncbi:aat family amino acid transporter [Alternaria alternata]|nr:aat family amino acid transporter [Alternaria alternata]
MPIDMDEEQRPLDRSPYYVTHSEHLDRVLSRPQLAGIGISGCIGGGVFITSGALIATTGSLGAAISYVVAGGIVACVMYTTTEMVTCRPLTGALIDLPHTFLDPASGFAIAASNTLTIRQTQQDFRHDYSHCTLGTAHCSLERSPDATFTWHRSRYQYRLHSPDDFFPLSWGQGSNVVQVEPARACLYHDGGVELWSQSRAEHSQAYWIHSTSITLAMFSFGTDLVAMTAGEAKNPWKDVPATMTFVYVIPVIMYPFAMFAAGSNVNYFDPDLSQMWTKSNGPTRSPFVIAAEHSSLHALPRVLTALFILSAYTTANTDLYAASRSVFMLSQQYLPRKVANIFGRTNNGHTPLAAILLCSALGFLSLVGLADRSSSQPTITLSEIYTGTATCINICLCITFLRFKAGLDRLAKRKIFGRNHPLYKSRLFKSRWQPLPAYIGMIGSTFVLVWSGIPPLIILIAKRNLSTFGNLKSSTSLAFDVIGAYIGPAIFAFLYLSYKFIYPRTSRVDIRNLTVEDYVLQDLSNIELEGPTCVPPVPRPRFASYEMDGQNDGIAGPSVMFEDPFKEDQSYADMSPDMQEEIEAEAARSNERARIRQILERRPERLRRGVWREIWSFVRTDKEE